MKVIENETDAKTVKLFSYGIASISLAIALYRIKPFAKFREPSSIPSRFLHKKVQLQGIVKCIESRCGTLLIVDHKPLIPLPRLSSKKYLPIKIAGVDVTNNGISWLQTIVNGKEISFIPLTKEQDYVNCIVSMQQDKEHIQIGEELTKLGFAEVKEDPLKIMMNDQHVLNYQKCLIRAQKWAQRKRNGHWHFVKHPTLLWRIQQSLDEKIKSIVPAFIARQLNI
ncbi:unnamed protein product [Xylocopa violacea]|uniref:Uncharacterized protein n=1 Tax=Xylocopa violacea TaxID=135666 RepID=A0ABP1P9T1_XYLVO